MPYKAIVPQNDPESEKGVSNVILDLGDQFGSIEQAAISMQERGYYEGCIIDEDKPTATPIDLETFA